eukprot:CAMPEP_0203868366 /NCGR_PEP_ID=MMETSP0359-20131031/17065_1 /ASSEMBLY_ACC=CAM_ASM_000338 /TAXON_ID=268821 /ORGANISM="Scrippsiella Hangoei, Strain SHTV-5" /LENGTH=414 /DNA_ID=CAMNT_0050786765 /DNA_START=80 /DNA_END=1324 /DNA_ORIENTATION=+
MSPIPLYILGMVMFGCLNTETTKIQFTLESRGIDGQLKPFHKPWQAVFTMFLAMDVVLIYHVLGTRRRTLAVDAAGSNGRAAPLLGAEAEELELTGCRRFMIVSVPAMFDLLGTGFGMIGFVYLPASINQMLRGSTIVFSSIFSVLFLGKRMLCYNWLGVVLCIVGISLVGLSNVLAAEHLQPASPSAASSSASANVAFGMSMNLLGQVFAASQIITEEKMLKSLKIPPMQVVGYEGVWGTILMICIVFPVNYLLPGEDNGSNENAYDTYLMLCNNHRLLCLICLYIFSCSTYNIAGMMVTGSLSAVHRTMLEASRTMVIWALNLFVHYFVDPTAGFGEAWTPYSYIQLAGFVVVIFGQTVYGGLLRVPGFTYDDAKLPVPAQSPGSLYSPVALLRDDRDDDKDVLTAEDLEKL